MALRDELCLGAAPGRVGTQERADDNETLCGIHATHARTRHLRVDGLEAEHARHLGLGLGVGLGFRLRLLGIGVGVGVGLGVTSSVVEASLSADASSAPG